MKGFDYVLNERPRGSRRPRVWEKRKVRPRGLVLIWLFPCCCCQTNLSITPLTQDLSGVQMVRAWPVIGFTRSAVVSAPLAESPSLRPQSPEKPLPRPSTGRPSPIDPMPRFVRFDFSSHFSKTRNTAQLSFSESDGVDRHWKAGKHKDTPTDANKMSFFFFFKKLNIPCNTTSPRRLPGNNN